MSSASTSSSTKKDEDFIKSTKERADLNQYWFSRNTIDVFVKIISCHVEKVEKPKVALVSCPSLYFSLEPEVRKSCIVLDIDKQWEEDPGFVYYDFNDPPEQQLSGHQDCTLVVIDPPYITEEVWQKYADSGHFLSRKTKEISLNQSSPADKAPPRPEVQFLCTTVFENRFFMKKFFDVNPTMFRPSIPNLVYQYCVYVNFETEFLHTPNNEIGDDVDWRKDAEKAEEEDKRRNANVVKSPPLKAAGSGGGWSKFLDEEAVAG